MALAADVRSSFHTLVEPSSPDAKSMRHVECIECRGTGTRIHLALRGLPEFTSLSGSDAAGQLREPIQIAPSLEYIEQAQIARRMANTPILRGSTC